MLTGSSHLFVSHGRARREIFFLLWTLHSVEVITKHPLAIDHTSEPPYEAMKNGMTLFDEGKERKL